MLSSTKRSRESPLSSRESSNATRPQPSQLAGQPDTPVIFCPALTKVALIKAADGTKASPALAEPEG